MVGGETNHATVSLLSEDAKHSHGDELVTGTEVQNAAPSWKDTFYDNERDIVAVFDLDHEAILTYHVSRACKAWICAVFVTAFASWLISMDDYALPQLLACIYFAFSVFLCIVATTLTKVAFAARHRGLHLAIMTGAIRYDQTYGNLCTLIPLRRVRKCSIVTLKRRRYWLCGKEHSVNIISFTLTDSKPTTYAGVINARAFQKLVVSQGDQVYRDVV